MHTPEFQKLEGTWRGLHYLVDNSRDQHEPQDQGAQRHARRTWSRTSRTASEFDQSALFKKVYEEEYGTFGGAPFGADRRLRVQPPPGGHGPARADLARGRGGARAVHLGGLARSCSASTSFTELAGPRDLAKIFDTVEYAKWKSFRESEDSRYVGLTTAARARPAAVRPEHRRRSKAFNFEEDVDGTDHDKYLWMNAAYALGTRAHRRLRQVRLVRGDPRRRGRRPGRRPADPHLHDRRRRRRHEVPDRDRHHRPPREGAEPISASCRWCTARAPTTPRSSATQSAQKPKKYDTDAANANARLSAQLPVHLRGLAHRALPEGDDARQDRQLRLERQASKTFLNHWITQYVLARRRRVAGNEGAVSRCARRGSRWPRSRASPGSSRRSPSCGRTSSSTS